MSYELSRGEQGRVAAAWAIVNLPPFLLADEPTGSFDQATGSPVVELLRKSDGEGQTVVMVTQDLQAAG